MRMFILVLVVALTGCSGFCVPPGISLVCHNNASNQTSPITLHSGDSITLTPSGKSIWKCEAQ